jgi:hypothetical protein
MFYAKALYEVATKEAEETGKYFPDNYYNGPELQDFDLYGQPTEERHRISAIRKKQMIKWLMVAGIILAISLLYAFAHAAEEMQGYLSFGKESIAVTTAEGQKLPYVKKGDWPKSCIDNLRRSFNGAEVFFSIIDGSPMAYLRTDDDQEKFDRIMLGCTGE